MVLLGRRMLEVAIAKGRADKINSRLIIIFGCAVFYVSINAAKNYNSPWV
jgi:hypothetical protein